MKKLTLKSLKVKSFITKIERNDAKKIKGGNTIYHTQCICAHTETCNNDPTGSEDFTCESEPTQNNDTNCIGTNSVFPCNQ